MENLVQDVLALFNNTHWDKLKKYSNIHSVDGLLHHFPSVHVQDITDIFKESNWTADERISDDYPIRLSIVVEGVQFFSIHRVEEFML